jgi:hypothetical protein
MANEKNTNDKPEENKNIAPTGNASNPGPENDQTPPGNKNQLLGEKAEKYIRESAPVEDYPDAAELDEAEKMMDEKAKAGRRGKDF